MGDAEIFEALAVEARANLSGTCPLSEDAAIAWASDRIEELEQYSVDLATESQQLQDALRDCVTHMKTAGSPKAVRAAEAAESLLEATT